jgi:hypothetical protein
MKIGFDFSLNPHPSTLDPGGERLRGANLQKDMAGFRRF